MEVDPLIVHLTWQLSVLQMIWVRGNGREPEADAETDFHLSSFIPAKSIPSRTLAERKRLNSWKAIATTNLWM